MAGGELYFGDNLDVLRQHIKDESVDLIYLDPPFNSKRDYNVLFAESDHTDSEAQIKAFEDCWHWDVVAERTYRELTGDGAEARGVPESLVTLTQAFRSFLGRNDMLAYLVMMSVRLVELRRVLKPNGSLYLHCDPTASHYIKLVLDAVFGPGAFSSEIIWKRTGAHNSANRFGPVHDVIFYYTRSDGATWNQQFAAYGAAYKTKFGKIDDITGQPFQDVTLTGPGVRSGPSGQPWRTFNPTTAGRHWQPASYIYTKYRQITGEELNQYPLIERLDKLDEAGLIYWPEKEGGQPRYKQFLEDAPGVPLQDVWTDIDAINSQAQERLGYPTQKPVALLERILLTSSNEGDVVLDPFCGCGTTVDAAQRLKRQWIGIDITHLAIALIRNRLETAFPGIAYTVVGEPVDAAGAKVLAESDPYQFQWWALHLIGARPVGEAKGKTGKKGKDRGVDGVIRFLDDPSADVSERILVSVKAGANIGPAMVRDLRGTIEREGARIGVLFTMEEPTAEMRAEAVNAGVWHSDKWNRDYARLQLITVEQAFAGKRVEYPGQDVTLRAAATVQPAHQASVLPGMHPAPVAGPRKARRAAAKPAKAARAAPAPTAHLFAAEPVAAAPARRARKARRK